MTQELQETASLLGTLSSPMTQADGRLILLARTGSRAYGTDHADSDHDFRGVYLASLRRFCSLGGVQESIVLNEPHDTTVYELGHFARLAAKGNPTALETLWSNDYLGSSAGETLRSHRGLFLSKRVVKTYGGYAISQLKKAEAGIGGSRGADHHKRTKFKLHTLRLILAGTRVLATGEVMVRVPFPSALRMVAEGELDEVKRYAEQLLRAMDEAAEKSTLPDHPDEQAINSLLYRIRRSDV